MEAKKTAKKKTTRKPKELLRSFVFVGDTVHANPNNPPSCTLHGYEFDLNGKPIKVKGEVAAKLAARADFIEEK